MLDFPPFPFHACVPLTSGFSFLVYEGHSTPRRLGGRAGSNLSQV